MKSHEYVKHLMCVYGSDVSGALVKDVINYAVCLGLIQQKDPSEPNAGIFWSLLDEFVTL